MVRTIFAGLLAATALVPTIAAAQRGDGRGDGRRGRGGEQQQAQAREQANAQVQAWVDADPRRGDAQPRPDRGDRGQGGLQGRRDGGDHTQSDRQGDAGRQGRRDDDRAAFQQRDGRGFDNRRDGGRAFQGLQGDRGFQDRRDDRGQGGFAQYRGGNQSQRGQWNRDWRNDGRYDWNRNRSVNRNAYRLPRYYAPSGWGYGYRRFSAGVVLTGGLFGQNYWIADPWSYRLPDAYGPYRWVRYYDDALLVDIRSGYVVDTVYGIFW